MGIQRYAKELEQAGWKNEYRLFKEVVADLYAEMAPGSTVDDLLLEPTKAARLCEIIRRKTKVAGLTDTWILKLLLRMRKAGLVPSSKERWNRAKPLKT